MLVILYLISSVFNPSLAIGVLLPEQTTYQLSGHIYSVHLENSFPTTAVAPGVFIEALYKEHFPAADDYFQNSGEPFTVRAYGIGAAVTFTLTDHILFSYGAGYYFGGFSYPVVQDSGRVVIEHDNRHSIGINSSVALLHSIKTVRVGIRMGVNIIPFGTRDRDSGSYGVQPPRIDHASLVSIGTGVQVGIDL